MKLNQVKYELENGSQVVEQIVEVIDEPVEEEEEEEEEQQPTPTGEDLLDELKRKMQRDNELEQERLV